MGASSGTTNPPRFWIIILSTVLMIAAITAVQRFQAASAEPSLSAVVMHGVLTHARAIPRVFVYGCTREDIWDVPKCGANGSRVARGSGDLSRDCGNPRQWSSLPWLGAWNRRSFGNS
jgi:hypothetical protein